MCACVCSVGCNRRESEGSSHRKKLEKREGDTVEAEDDEKRRWEAVDPIVDS